MMNKKGSASVFLTLVLGAMVSLTIAYITMAEERVQVSNTNDTMILAHRSVLSEFHPGLKDRYGIFAFRGTGSSVEEKINYYMSRCKRNGENYSIESLAVATEDHSLVNLRAFEEEVLSYAHFALGKNLLKEFGETEGPEENPLDYASSRSLNNKRVLESLPSRAFQQNNGWGDHLISNIGSLEEAFEEGSNNILINQYIFSLFGNRQNLLDPDERFFQYEIEYILAGKESDSQNMNTVSNEILLIRNGINLGFIYTDPEKRALLIAATASMAPGPEAIVAQLILAEAWALAEAQNDIALLEHGKKVPIYKTADTWAVDLQSVLEDAQGEYIDTHAEVGLTYEGYLQCMLFFMNQDKKIARLMDLIQINMQRTEDRYFLLQDYQRGFVVDAVVEGKNYHYTQQY